MQKCNECDFAAFKKSNLKGHKKRHIGNFPFKCTQCDYASITQTDIVIHMRKHSGERPFKCTLCSFASSVVGALNVHIKRHGGEQYLNAVNAFTREYHCLNWRDIWKCTAKKGFTNVSNVGMHFTIKETSWGICKTQWRKTFSVQPVRVCLLSEAWPENTFTCTQRREGAQM